MWLHLAGDRRRRRWPLELEDMEPVDLGYFGGECFDDLEKREELVSMAAIRKDQHE